MAHPLLLLLQTRPLPHRLVHPRAHLPREPPVGAAHLRRCGKGQFSHAARGEGGLSSASPRPETIGPPDGIQSARSEWDVSACSSGAPPACAAQSRGAETAPPAAPPPPRPPAAARRQAPPRESPPAESDALPTRRERRARSRFAAARRSALRHRRRARRCRRPAQREPKEQWALDFGLGSPQQLSRLCDSLAPSRRPKRR